MFTLTFVGSSISTKNPMYIKEHLIQSGIECGILDDINFFKDAALPEVPFGRFLVSAKEWEDAGFPDNAASSSAQLDLTITGRTKSVTFSDLPILSIGYLMAGITTPASSTDPDLGRMLVVEVGGIPSDYTSYPTPALTLYNNNTNDVNFDDFVTNAGILPVVPNFNSYRSVTPLFPSTGALNYIDFVHFIANAHFCVGHINYKTASGTFDVTNAFSTVNATGCRLLYSHVLVNQNPATLGSIAFQTYLPNRVDVQVFSDGADEVDYTESTLYFKAEWGTARGSYHVFYPFMKVNPNDSILTNATALSIFNILKANMAKRLVRNLRLHYTDVVNCTIGMDIQRVTYRVDDKGMTTLLESVPWENYYPFAFPLAVPCTEQVELFTLRTPWYNGVAFATFTKFGSIDYWPSEKTGIIEDPLAIYAEMKVGKSGYSIRTCDERHIAMAANCNTKYNPVPPVNPVGKCCYQSGAGFGCFEGTASDCSSWGGTYGGDGTSCSSGCTSGAVPINDNSNGFTNTNSGGFGV